ncbi:hypothetical protein FHS79_003261 [Polymorphobacter multimanifer]|uniref:Uncharacterized protein n=1 Tax=Polymorphobacter multimanifer TaxID=1070431 RepID=A0A841LIL2_9SPHN|nr:hypothetical protein [Polymorphobacter multimanifer]
MVSHDRHAKDPPKPEPHPLREGADFPTMLCEPLLFCRSVVPSSYKCKG